MSVCHWICEGIGVRDNDIYGYLNQSKCLSAVKHLLPDDVEVQKMTVDEFNIDDFMFCEPFESLGDFLSRLDDRGVLSYGDNNDGETYCYYSPTYPWYITNSDPRSLQEARAYVKDVVRKVCDIDEETLDKIIDNDIYEYGCG